MIGTLVDVDRIAAKALKVVLMHQRKASGELGCTGQPCEVCLVT